MNVSRTLARQMDPAGSILLWNPWMARKRSGVLLDPRACGNQECECRTITLIGYAIDDALSGVTRSDKGLTFSFTSESHVEPGVVADVQVDVHTGVITPTPGGEARCDPAAIALLEREIDAALLDEFARRHLMAKGWEVRADRWRTADWSRWSPGELVSWIEAFGEPREDRYVHGDRLFLAIEMYCVVPGCTCDDVRVQFAEVIDETGKYVGTVLVRPPSAQVISVDTGDGSSALILELWSAFVRRHRGTAALRERRARIRAVGPGIMALAAKAAPKEVPAAAPTAPRVGRNEPCFCGSGKKFKRCHGA